MFKDLIYELSCKITALDNSRDALIHKLYERGLFDADPYDFYRVSEIPEHIIVGFQVTLLGMYGELLRDKGGIIPNPQYVSPGKDALPIDPPEIEGYNFTGYVPSISNVTCDLTSVAQYAKRMTILYRYNTDDEIISVQTYPYGATDVQFIDLPKRKNHTVYGFEPKDPSYIVPLTSNYTVHVIDVKNSIEPSIVENMFKYDGKPHGLSVISVIMEPEFHDYAVYYRENGGEWQSDPICHTDIGLYEIQYKLSADNFPDYIGNDILQIKLGTFYDVKYYYRNYNETVQNVVTHKVLENGGDTPPQISNTISSIFLGWDPDSYKRVTQNLSVNALYKTMEFDVYFYWDWYYEYRQIQYSTVKYGDRISNMPTPHREGWQRDGWQDEQGYVIPNDVFNSVTHNISAYARFNKIVRLKVYSVVGQTATLLKTYNALSGDSILSDRILDDIGREGFIHFDPPQWNPLNVQPDVTDVNISAYYAFDGIAVSYHNNIPITVTYKQGY